MEKKRVLVIYYSEKRNTMFMAMNIAHSLKILGLEADINQVEKCSPELMSSYDGILIGSPTYFSNMSWQVKKFIDNSASIRNDGFPLEGKIGGAFTSSGTRRDGEECLKMIELALCLHHKMRVIPGIVVESTDSEENIVKTCHDFCVKIAEVAGARAIR